MSIVYTGGTFDLFHSGHVNLLKRCKEIAGDNGTVVAAVNKDEFILETKGKLPVCNLDERKAVLLGCKYVDKVITNIGDYDSKIPIEFVMPDYVVIGSDWARKDYYKQMQFDQDWLDERNIGLIYIPYSKGISSTNLKQRMSL
jgi:cytidyltransferase-like protein